VLTAINFSDRNNRQGLSRYGALKDHGMVCSSKWLSREDLEATPADVAGRSKVLGAKGI
jgi:hypothetical protein